MITDITLTIIIATATVITVTNNDDIDGNICISSDNNIATDITDAIAKTNLLIRSIWHCEIACNIGACIP